jgi:hypothetical protein
MANTLADFRRAQKELEEKFLSPLLKRQKELRAELVEVDRMVSEMTGHAVKRVKAVKAVPNGTGKRRTSGQVKQDAEDMAENIVGVLKALKARDKDSAKLVTEIGANMPGTPSTEALAPGIDVARRKHDLKFHGQRRGRRYYLA